MPRDDRLAQSQPSGTPSPYKKPPPTSPPQRPHEPSKPPTPFKMNFGKHEGLLLSELEPAYVRFMIKDKVWGGYLKRPEVKAALLNHRYMTEDGTPGPDKPAGQKPPTEPPEGWALPKRSAEELEDRDQSISSKAANVRYKLTVKALRAHLTPSTGAATKKEHWYEWQVIALAKAGGFVRRKNLAIRRRLEANARWREQGFDVETDDED